MKLDNTEKNYLKDVITATRVYLNKPEVYVRKLALNSLGINRECIVIQASTSDAEAAINSITLPTFEAGTMYTGLVPNVLYKLNDLLNEQETPELNRKEYNFLVSLLDPAYLDATIKRTVVDEASMITVSTESACLCNAVFDKNSEMFSTLTPGVTYKLADLLERAD